MSKVKITITIQAYNVEKYIGKAIESVINQTESSWELFIRNNGSMDNTGSICKQYAEKDSRIYYFENKVNGVTDNNEPWFPTYNGEYYTCLDGDDYWENNFLEILYNKAKEVDADMVIAGYEAFQDETNKELGQSIPNVYVFDENNTITDVLFIELYRSLRPIWGKMYRNDDKKGGIYNKDIPPKELQVSRDTFYVLSYLQHCKKIATINKALYHYRVRKDSFYHAKKVDKQRIGEADILLLKGKQTAEKLGILNNQIISFLCNVHYHHLLDLKDLSLRSRLMTEEKKVEMLECILNNQILSMYVMRGENYLDVLKWLGEAIEFIKMETEIKNENLANTYLVRLIDAWENRELREGIETFMLVLSAIFDCNNQTRFGQELIFNNKIWIPKIIEDYVKGKSIDKISINNIVSCLIDSNGDYNDKKQEVLKYIDCHDYEQAYSIVREILSEKTLDREALYFNMYLNAVLGNITNASITCELVRAFYSTDSEMMDLYEQVNSIILNPKSVV